MISCIHMHQLYRAEGQSILKLSHVHFINEYVDRFKLPSANNLDLCIHVDNELHLGNFHTTQHANTYSKGILLYFDSAYSLSIAESSVRMIMFDLMSNVPAINIFQNFECTHEETHYLLYTYPNSQSFTIQ